MQWTGCRLWGQAILTVFAEDGDEEEQIAEEPEECRPVENAVDAMVKKQATRIVQSDPAPVEHQKRKCKEIPKCRVRAANQRASANQSRRVRVAAIREWWGIPAASGVVRYAASVECKECAWWSEAEEGVVAVVGVVGVAQRADGVG